VVVPSVFGKIFEKLNLENDISRNCLLGHRNEIAKFLMKNFTLPLYLPLWVRSKEVSGYGADIRTYDILYPLESMLCSAANQRKVFRQSLYRILIPLSFFCTFVLYVMHPSKTDF
jgi:hypothetical protein